MRGPIAAAVTTLLIATLGCTGTNDGLLSTRHVSVGGTVQGALRPIANAEVHLYAADPQDTSALENVELAPAVRSDGRGVFQFPAPVACPTRDALLYLKTTAGVPAATGFANPSIALLNVLGTCSSLAAQTTATINELTTVGAAWPLSAFADDRQHFLVGSGQATQFSAAVQTVGKLVNSELGTTPGRLLAADEAAPVAAINSLADVIAACVATNGGSAGDGSACGQMFSLAGNGSAKPPTDTLAATLLLARSPARNVTGLYTLSTSKAFFQPTLAVAPFDWTLQTRAGETQPVAAAGASASLATPSDNSSSAADVAIPATESTTPVVGRLQAQATPLVANTIVIKTGGTYQGDWVSTDPTVPAVTVQTDQPVILENSTVTGRGNLIVATGSSGANLTLQNVTGTGLDPLVAGKARGGFLVAYVMNSLTVQNCTMMGTQFGIKLGFSTATSITLRNNNAINLEDRASDGSGGFQNARPQMGHFIYFYQVVAPNGAEVGWNQLVQTVGQSSIDNAVEFYKSQGSATTPIVAHDNYVEGMSSLETTMYTASGFTVTGDNTTLESTYISFLSNEVVHTAGSGLTIANGHDIAAQSNRVISCGQDAAGNWMNKAGVYAIALWNRSNSPDFSNNTMTSTAGGLVIPNTASQPAAADSSANPVDLQTASNSISGNQFTDPCIVGGVLTPSAEDAERTFWTNKVSANGQTIGDQHGPVVVTVTPATDTLAASKTSQLSASVTWASNTGVTWTISPSVGTISSTGLYTAPSSITTSQVVTVTATSQQNSSKTGSATLTLSPLVSVSVTPITSAIQLSETSQLTATVSNSTNTAVTWSLSPATGTLSSNGLYTAPASGIAQDVTITATSVADSTKTASAVLTLGAAVGVSVTPATASLTLSQAQQLAATVTNAANTAVTWSISPAVGSISAAGVYTAPSSLTALTTVTVTAASVADPTKTAFATLTVSPSPVTVSPDASSLYASQSQQFTAQAQGTTNPGMVWSMSPSVGTLSTDGLYTAPSSITSQQNVAVTAYSLGTGKYNSVRVTLLPPVTVNLYSTYFVDTVNQTSQLSAQVGNASNTAVTWSINPAVGSVSATGLYTAPASITAQQTIAFTATSVADPTKSASGSIVLNPPVKVTMATPAATLLPGASQQFTAYVAWSSNTAVTWSMSPSLGTLSSSGLYTAPSSTTSVQTVVLTATSVADPTKSATAVVTLSPPVGVSITPASSVVTLGQTQIYTATVVNASNTSVTWSISPAVGSISTGGRYTPPTTAVTSPQTVTVTATSAADTTKAASSVVTVNPPVTIAVSPTSTSLYASQAVQLTPAVQWDNNQGATYSLSSAVGTISTTGLYTAPSSVTTQQSVSVTVSSVADPSKYVLASITLLPPVRVTLYSSYFVDTVNQTSQLSAQVGNASNTAVTWTLSPVVGSVSATGLYTAPASITAQQTIAFTATSVADPTKSASGSIVLNPPVKVTMATPAATLLPGTSQQFTAYVAWSSNTAVTWSMSPSLGTLTSTGVYTAPSDTTSVQTVVLSATSVADPTKSATAVVTLNPPVSVSVTPASAVVTLGQTQLYAATVLNTTNTNVTWSVSPALGTISSGGRYSPPTTAVTSPETATVTATSVVDATRSASATITVNPPVAIAVSPTTASLYASQTQQFTPSVTWNANQGANYSLSPAVGTISATGLYTAPSTITTQQGVSVTISSAADPSKYVTASITLLPAVQIRLYSSYFADTVNQTSQFSAQVLNTSNTAVTWSIAPAVGTISATGLYTAPATIAAQQTIAVTATSVAEPSQSVTGTVLLSPPVSVVMVPAAVTLTRSHSQQFVANVAWSSNTAVVWTQSAGSAGTLTSTGLYTSPDAVDSNSTLTVTATSAADPTKSATATVNLLTLVGPAPIVITEGGTYSGNWISNDPTVAAVTINTDAPVTIQNSTLQSQGHLISIAGITGANVTIQNVTGTGLDPLIAGQARGVFVNASIMNSLTVQNTTFSGTSYGIKVSSSPAMASLTVLNNVGSGLDDRASDGQGGLLTTRPTLGHFIILHDVVTPNGANIGWNQLKQIIGQTSTEDAINIFKSKGAPGYPIVVHDNYLEGYSSSTTTPYTGNGLITDGDAAGFTSYVVFQANEIVHTAGGGVAIANGHDNSAVANRVVSCGKDSSGMWYSRSGTSAATVWNYYGASNFNNNTITTTAGGLVAPNAYGVPTISDGGTEGSVGNSTNSGNLFTDPCFVGGTLSLAAEDAERAYWANKLSTNNIALGDQH